MRHQNTLFHALLKFVPRHRFEAIVGRFAGDHRTRRLPCWSQFVAMLFAQLAGAQSLRELEAALSSHADRLYHLGAARPRRSTLSDANAKRPVAIFEGVFALLLGQLRDQLSGQASEALRLIDATPVALSRLSGWARFSDRWNGAKAHVVYDPHARVPTYFAVTPAKTNDIVAAKRMPIEAGATYVFDKAYYDFAWWAKLDAAGCRFVTRLKENSPVQSVKQHAVAEGPIRSDQLVRLNPRLARSRKNPYDKPLRCIVVAIDKNRELCLVSNDLEAPASEIAALYKARWQIELFFKWVKQNLKIRRFLGTSENAVKIQIITALIAYLLIRLAQHRHVPSLSLQRLARLIRINLMHRKRLTHLLRPPTQRRRHENPQITMELGLVC